VRCTREWVKEKREKRKKREERREEVR